MSRRRRRTLLGLVVLALAFAAAGVRALSAQALEPNDPLYRSRGSWGEQRDDQWGLKRVGFSSSGRDRSAWERLGEARHPVIVAVLDSGLDYLHPDLRPENVWRNPKEAANQRDDDGNGYVDDLIGWNFVDGNNNPWDTTGHGTHVAGIIAAATGNGIGIAGINPLVKVMPLKVLDVTGRGRVVGLAEAVLYAVRNGARIINLSLGGHGISRTERLAIEHARQQDVLVVVAAGNVAADTAAYGPAGLGGQPGVITVAATGPDDERVAFSNWGQAVKIAAPGVDILSLRARRTDLNLAMGISDYKAGTGFVGRDQAYYRTSGTSFAAPFVTGVASLILSRNPRLTGAQVERMLLMSADDVEVPGWDLYTGAGRLNAIRALQADPDWYLIAQVKEVQPVREGGRTVIQVRGTVVGSRLAGYRLELGKGEAPPTWKPLGREVTAPLEDGVLGTIPISEITSRGQWTIRVVARGASGEQREARGTLTVE
jgi:subtilisin family serine protease